MKRIPINEATDAQIYNHLQMVLGVNPGPKNRVKRATLEAKLNAADPEAKFVLVDDETEEAPLVLDYQKQPEAAPPKSKRAKAESPPVDAAPATEQAAGDEDLTDEERLERARARRDSEIYEVIIERSDEPDGDQPVWLAVNGRGQFVERGKPQRIRRPYFEVLVHAVKRVWDQDEEGNMIPREVPAYPYRLLSQFMPEDAPERTSMSGAATEDQAVA